MVADIALIPMCRTSMHQRNEAIRSPIPFGPCLGSTPRHWSASRTSTRGRLPALSGPLLVHVGLLYEPELTHLRTYLGSLCLLAGLHATVAQSTWPVDSLLTTWPIDQRMPELKVKPRPADPIDTDDLYADLRRIAPLLPVLADSLVDAYVQLFAGPRREHFRMLLGRALEYEPLIERELARHGLPAELKVLPLAMSAMNSQAYSNSGEAGLWMLTYPVAMRHGLTVTPLVDERRDPQKSTVAAMRHLQDLHAHYGDWPSTVIAFTCGPANLTRARQRSGSADPRLLYPHLDKGHRHVLPLLMAFTYLRGKADALDIEPLVFRNLEPSDTVRFDSTLVVAALTKVVGTRPSRFRALNPVLTGAKIPAGEPFLLPRSEAARFNDLAFIVLEAQTTKPRAPSAVATITEPESVESLPDGREAILYRIEEGDCMGCIADRFGVGLSEMKAWNELKGDQIEVGNTLILYVPKEQRLLYEGSTNGTRPDTTTVPLRSDTTRTTQARRRLSPATDGSFDWYTVKGGDSLYLIAKRYQGISASDLMEFNGISANIRPGQRIKIPTR